MIDQAPPIQSPDPATTSNDWLFGWDPTPGIVSVWAERSGRAVIWRRDPGDPLAGVGGVTASAARFRPWLFATSLDDLAHLGPALSDQPGAPIGYAELDGPPGSHRFLLSARDGRALERAILTGAARRLGHAPRNLYAAGEGYYWVGPVEQYLMQTGRTYFRDLTYADLHRLQFDLETTALSPERGRIFMAAVRDSRGLATILEAPTAADEPALIADLCALICARDPDVIENHNLFGFDLPFLHERASRHKVPLRLGRAAATHGPQPLLERYEEPGSRNGFGRRRRVRFSVAGRELIDTLDAVWRHDFTVRTMAGYGLKAAARHFGVASPERTYIPGHAIFATYAEDPERVRRYALDDVAEVDGLSQRLLGASFALAGMAPRRYERVASAGTAMGILEPMLVRAYLRAGAALPPAADGADQGAHSGGATYLFAAGAAQQIVKTDIASMYPSIMRVYQIGPACDRIHALRTLVERLTDLRLRHKDAARAAAPGSLAAHEHEALQAAMKLLINSAYGYMGAGSMALFADRHAADAVTGKGREILDQVVAALREHGMALLEADTDGVYFAAPLGWSEDQERAVVAAVARTLPNGLRLEYEGRYRAMLSHEVKNYALLTYGGELIVRGVALRSSRAEPFGERFLARALRCLLEGDMAGLQAAYHETAAALRSRTIPVAEVATRARLTKTPDEYQQSRAKLRESPYEALLAAGRSAWMVGEKVWFYRDSRGRFVWLPSADPDENAESGSGDGVAAGERETPEYDSEHYVQVLRTSYMGRLRKAFEPGDFEQLLRQDGQRGLFDRPVEEIAPRWIRASAAPPQEQD